MTNKETHPPSRWKIQFALNPWFNIPPRHAAALDGIGDPAYLNRGLGTQILREFLKQVVFQDKDIEGCLVDPSPDNARMIKVDEKVGFKYLTTTTGPDPKYLMVIRREEFEALG